MNSCNSTADSAGLIGSVTHFIDCRAELLGAGGWQALSLPGSTLSLVLTGFLTIFIAMIGYRLLLGDELSVRTGTLAMVKIGMVFALATSWPAYSSLVYDLVTRGPSEIVSEIGPAGKLPGTDGTLVRRLDLADAALVHLAILGAGSPAMMARDTTVAPPPFSGFNAFALGGSRITFLLTAITALATVRIVAALFLALGPFFIAFLLFDSTRSLFEGWVRVLAGAGIGAIGVSILLGFELALVEPWLSASLSRRAAGDVLASLPTELLVITLLFAILSAVTIGAAARVAGAFRMALLRSRQISAGQPAKPTGLMTGLAHHMTSQPERSRARLVADGLMTLQRHEARQGAATVSANGEVRARQTSGTSFGLTARGETTAPPFARRWTGRVSASANRRDARK